MREESRVHVREESKVYLREESRVKEKRVKCMWEKSYNELQWNWKNEKKRRIAHPWVFRGTASAPFVPAQGFRAHGNSLSPHPRPLSTAVLARTIGKLPKHHASASAKSRDVNRTGDFNRYIVRVSARQQPHPYGRSVGNTAPCLSRHGQPAATILKGKETVAWCAS